MKTDIHIENLIARHMRSELNDQEFRELEEWVASSEENLQLFLRLTDAYYPARDSKVPAQLVELYGHQVPVVPIRRSRRRIAMMAAGFIGTIAFAGIMWFLVKNQRNTLLASNQVMLTVSPGKQFHVTFNDGTVVHASAGTIISYPQKYSAANRTVTILDGEAFFEVAKTYMPDGKTKYPFHVVTRDGSIEVTGTKFNVAAYKEQPIRATLLEGGINYTRGNEIKKIHPGEQAIIVSGKPITITDTVSADVVTAWRKDQFRFEGATIEEIMAQAGRWYNMQVEIRSRIPRTFNVTNDKKKPLSSLVARLEATGNVKIKIDEEERKIVVMSQTSE